MAETMRNLYDGVPIEEVYKAAILAARTLIEKDPDYTYATARLLLHTIVKEVLGTESTQAEMAGRYADYFPQYIQKGVDNELLDPQLLEYDLVKLGAALKASRDLQFDYLGLQETLYDRYFLQRHDDAHRAAHMPSSCAWPSAWRCTKANHETRAIGSTNCCPRSTSCPTPPRCSPSARSTRSCPGRAT